MKRSILCIGALLVSQAVFGQTVVDLGTSGVQDNGTLSGAAVLTNDAVYGSGAVSLPPGDDSVVALTQPVTDLDMDGSYTFMTWFKNESAGEKGLVVLGNCCDGPTSLTNRTGYTMTITSAPAIRFWGGSSINDSNHNTYSPTTPAINDGNWHHAAIRVQPGQVDIFFDGVLVSTNTESNIPTKPSEAAENAYATFVPKVGGDGISYGSSASTLVDDVRVYGSALTDQGVVDAMNNAGPLPDRLYYTFDDDSLLNTDTLRVKVTKTFSDGNDDDVQVTLTCNSGLPLKQSFTITGGDPAGVTFVVTDIPEGGANCEVTESGSADGYTPEFNGGSGCSWDGVLGGLRSCTISNVLDTVRYTVNKEWLFNEEDDGIERAADVTVYCENMRSGPSGSLFSGQEGGIIAPGNDSWSFDIYPNWTTPATRCRAVEEQLISGVESDQGCSEWVTLVPGGEEQSCTITNTVFFEGIPTLSRSGLAILVVLTLAVGLVGFRRFT